MGAGTRPRPTGRRRQRILAALAIAGVCAGLSLGPVTATTTVDEHQTQTPTGWQRYSPHAIAASKAIPGVALAQTFVPRVNGQLLGVDLFAYAVEDWNEPVVMELRSGGPDGAVLAYSTVPLTSVPRGFTADWMPVTFGAPVDVKAGKPVTMVLPVLQATVPDGASNQPILFWGRRLGNAYAPADGWLGSRPAGPKASDQAAWAKVPADYSFRTHVTSAPDTSTAVAVPGTTSSLPTPSPLLLLLIAFVGVASMSVGWRRLARRSQALAAAEAAAAASVVPESPAPEPDPSHVSTSDFVRLTGGSATPRYRTFQRRSRRD